MPSAVRTTKSVARKRTLRPALALLAAIGLWLVPMWLAVERSGDPAFAAYRDNILFRARLTAMLKPGTTTHPGGTTW